LTPLNLPNSEQYLPLIPPFPLLSPPLEGAGEVMVGGGQGPGEVKRGYK